MFNFETFFNNKDLKRFFFPGKILWGVDCRHCLMDLIESSQSIALIVDAFFHQSPFVKEFQQHFGHQIAALVKVEGMPRTENIRRLTDHLGEAPDIIVSIGGGSCIDTAKAAMATFLYGTFEGVGMGTRLGLATLKGKGKPLFISLPTTPATGADASRYYVTYDTETHGKVHGKSWKLIADWILLDPYFIRSLPDPLLITSAFDAFIHFFESFLCKYERSWFGEMLSVDGILRILRSLDHIIHHKHRNDEHLLQLLYASTMAGMAVSNVRTGSIHEAAGALLEHTTLSHPETLFVFLRATHSLYHEHINDRENLLLQRLQAEYPQSGFASFENIIEWWERLYEDYSITAKIVRAISDADISLDELCIAIFDRVYSDKVWIDKESPLSLDRNTIESFIHTSLTRFGSKANGRML